MADCDPDSLFIPEGPAFAAIDGSLSLSTPIFRSIYADNKRKHDSASPTQSKKQKSVHFADTVGVMAFIDDTVRSTKSKTRATSIGSNQSDESSVAESRSVLHRSRFGSGTKTITVYPEGEVLVGFQGKTQAEIDDLPCHLLTDVDVTARPTLAGDDEFLNRSILLQAQPGSTLKIFGTLIVDEDNEGQLIKRPGKNPIDLTNKRIMLKDVQMFSIGYTSEDKSFQLWVLSDAGWYLVSPSVEYRPIYDQQMKVVKLRYTIEIYYFEQKNKKLYKSIEEEALAVLELCSGLYAGNGDVISDWVKLSREYQGFLLLQMEKMGAEHAGSGVVVKVTPFYKWLKRGSFNLPPLPTHYASEPYPLDYTTSSTGDDGSSEDATDEDSENIESEGGLAVVQTNTSTPAKEKLAMNHPFHGAWRSPEFDKGCPQQSSFVVQARAVLCHAIASERCKPEKLTVSELVNAMYQDINIGHYLTCKDLVEYYGEEIIQGLPKEKFNKLPFWAALDRPRKDITQYEDAHRFKVTCAGNVKLDAEGEKILNEKSPKIYALFKEIIKDEQIEKGPRLRRRTKQRSLVARNEMNAKRKAKKQLGLSNGAPKSSVSKPQSGKKSRRPKLDSEMMDIVEPRPEQDVPSGMTHNQGSWFLRSQITTAARNAGAVSDDSGDGGKGDSSSSDESASNVAGPVGNI
ncbi:hypothetical protein VTL71DRAFT_211 [Oculimacula yallundae]|uniref:RFTS domain-containing protein n=1 Tax=Oculimacula yallundae TaxID=86028 RepID=A0ABR4CZI5_9HELO